MKNLLAKKIEKGILEPGDDVAVILEAQEFGVGVITARRAFRALVAEERLIPPPREREGRTGWRRGTLRV